jgi:hypothetical protein
LPPDRTLLVAALAFAAAAVHGAWVAIRDDVPGEPLGVTVPLSVPTGLAVGWGAGVAAPWPMPVVALLAASTPPLADHDSTPGWVATGLGAACIVGTLVEPVTYGRRARTAGVRRAVVVNIAASAALAVAGVRYVASSKQTGPARSPTLGESSRTLAS